MQIENERYIQEFISEDNKHNLRKHKEIICYYYAEMYLHLNVTAVSMDDLVFIPFDDMLVYVISDFSDVKAQVLRAITYSNDRDIKVTQIALLNMTEVDMSAYIDFILEFNKFKARMRNAEVTELRNYIINEYFDVNNVYDEKFFNTLVKTQMNCFDADDNVHL